MADNRPAAPETFDAAKNYIGVKFVDGDVLLLGSELNELQQIRDYMTKLSLDRVFREGVIGELGGTIGTPVAGVSVGGQTLSASGTFVALETITYTIRIITGGAVGTATFDFTTSGNDASPGPVTITAYDVWHDLGMRGAKIKWSGSGVFVLGDSWILTCSYNISMPTIVTGEVNDTIAMVPAYVYFDGKMLLVPSATLTYAHAVTGKSYVYLEALTKLVTSDDDGTLLNPRTLQQVARREMILVSFQDHDTSGEVLLTRCTKRIVRQVYEWDRETGLVTRAHESYSRLDLNQLSGILLSDRVQKFDVQEEVKGILAERTDDESGSYIVEEKNLISYVQAAENTFAIDNPVADGGNSGDDTPTIGGVYKGTTGEIYAVEITTGGLPGTARITVTGMNGDDSGPTLIDVFGEAISIGTRGVTLTFPAGGDGLLTVGDIWTVRCVDPATIAVKTMAGSAYVNGMQYKKLDTELLPVAVANTTASVEDELRWYVFGTNAYKPSKTAGDEGFAVSQFNGVSAEVLVRKVMSHPVGDGKDLLPKLPAARILAVTDTHPAAITGTETGPFNFSGTGADHRHNCLKVQASPYAGGAVGAVQTIYFTPGSWTIAQVLEALNQGTGPAYQTGSANNNLWWSSSSGSLKCETMGGSSEQIVLFGNVSGGSRAQEVFGIVDNATDTGTGTQYDETTDWVLDGDYIDWAPGGAEPTGSYWIVYTYSMQFAGGTDYVFHGELTGTKAWCVVAVRGSATKSWPVITGLVNCSPDGDIVELSWGTVPNANEYEVYRGDSTDIGGMLLIAVLPSTATGYVDTGYITGGVAASNTGNNFMTPVMTEKWVRGAVNLNVPYAPAVSGSEFEMNRPYPGEMINLDYYYYQPRYVIRVVTHALDPLTFRHVGVLEDIEGKPDDIPREPKAPLASLPIARIYCPANGHEAIIYNFNYRRTTMIELRSLVQQVEDNRYNLAQIDMVQQARNQESAALRGVWADDFTISDRGDITHPDFDCAINQIERSMRLPFDVTTIPLVMPTNVSGIKQHRNDVTLAYTPQVEITQDNWSTEWNVNPYAVFYPEWTPNAWVIISPARDYWVDTTTITYPDFFLESWHLWIGGGAATAAAGPPPEYVFDWETFRTELKLLKNESAAVARVINIEVYGQNFEPGAAVEIRFSDTKVQANPRSGWLNDTVDTMRIMADPGGNFQCYIAVPAGTATGQHQIRAIGYSAMVGHVGDVTNDVSGVFVSEGRIEVFAERKIKAHYYIDPICQTFRFVSDGFLLYADIPMAAKDVALPLQFLLRDVANGIPTEDADVVETRTAAEVSAGGTSHNYWPKPAAGDALPADPIFMDSRYSKALTLMTESPEGYKAYVAEGGKEDHLGNFIAAQPYVDGVFMTSSNFQTWTPHQNADLRFSAYSALFSTVTPGEMVFDAQSWDDHTEISGLMLVVGQEMPSGTSIDWQYRVLPTGSSDPISTMPWRTIVPNQYFDLTNETVESVQLKATLRTTNGRLTPTISWKNMALILLQNCHEDGDPKTACYLSDTSDLVASVDTVKVYIEEYNPSGTGKTSEGQITGDEVEPFVVGGAGNTIKLKVDGGGEQTATIISGTRSADQVVADFAGITGLFTAANEGGRLKLSATTSVEITEIGAGVTTLGLRVGTYLAQSGQHEVLLSSDNGHSWMSPSIDIPGSTTGQGYVSRTLTFGGDADFNLYSIKLKVSQETSARYLIPRARKLTFTMT